MTKKMYKNIEPNEYFIDPDIGIMQKQDEDMSTMVQGLTEESKKYSTEEVVFYENPDERFEITQQPLPVKYKRLVKGWIETAEERAELMAEDKDYSGATQQQNYAEGLSQALILFEDIYNV